MKKLILITTLIVCVCAFAIMHTDDSDAAIVGSGTCGTDLNWEYDSATTTLTISGSGTTMSSYGSPTDVPWVWQRTTGTTIVFNTPNLTNLCNYFAQNWSHLTSVELPNTLLTIDNSAFRYCTSLTNITIPNTVRDISRSAFDSCNHLSSILIPLNVTSISDNAFDNCTSLKSVYNKSNLNIVRGADTYGKVAKYADIVLGGIPTASGTCGTDLNWAYITENTTLYIYGNGTTMSEYRSSNPAPWKDYRSGIKNLIFVTPNLTTIGTAAFTNCTSLVEVTIPDTVKTLKTSAFNLCGGLTSIYIPKSVTTIEQSAFGFCTNLQHIYWDAARCTAPTSGNFAFTSCTGIVDVTIGENVESLPNYLFYENSAVTSWTTINWNAVDCADFSQDNMIFHNDKIHTIIFGDSVKHVPAYLTREFNDTLESVSFNDGLESIGDGAFQNSAIVVLGLPSTVKSVGVWSFNSCPNVMIRTLPTGMESIGSNAFANCSGITEMLIPVGFNATISDGAFANNTNLKTVLNLSDLNIEKGATTYGSIGAYADEVRNDIPSIGIVQQKDHIVHETVEKTDMASTLLRILPALMVIAILSFIVGALYYRSRDLNE